MSNTTLSRSHAYELKTKSGWTYKDIGAEFNMHPEAVRAMVRRYKAKAKQRVADYAEDSDVSASPETHGRKIEGYTQIQTTGKFMALSCTHGNLLDENAFAAFMRDKEEYKPKHMIMLGDLFEFTALRKGATDDEKRINVEEDIEWGLWTLGEMMRGIKGERWCLRGNHCERLWQMHKTGTVVGRDFAALHIKKIEEFLEDNKIRTKPYCSTQGVIQINDVLFMHGYGFGVNAAKDHMKIYHKDVVFGHTHRSETAVGTGWPMPLESLNVGMMMKKFPQYASRTTSVLSWNHAYCKGEFLKNGSHTKHLITL